MPSAEHESYNADPTKTSSNRTLARLARFGQSGTGITHQILVRLAWPYIELPMRWWLAKVICLRGLAGVMDFPGVLEAARFEYPGHFMSSAAAIYAGTCIEVLAGVLLAIGFMTRYAALALLLISIGIQFAYAPFDSQLFWIAMFTRFAIYGAGPMSLNNLLRRGLSESALLLIPRIVRGLVHVGFLFGVRNPIATVMNRFWAYLRFGGGMTERPSKLALARSRCIGQPNR